MEKEASNIKWIQCYCWFYSLLTASKKQRFLSLLEEFISEMKFVGVGIELSLEIKIAVGGWAVLLILSNPMGLFWYRHIERISIYPGKVLRHNLRHKKVLGTMAGGSHYCQINLAWDEVREFSTKSSVNRNTIIHEFAHALDYTNRVTNGMPSLLIPNEYHEQWKSIFSEQYRRSNLCKHNHGRWKCFGRYYKSVSDLCEYDIAEMFSYSSELFFEHPKALNNISPEIYQCLKVLYEIDPMQDLAKRNQNNLLLSSFAGILSKFR